MFSYGGSAASANFSGGSGGGGSGYNVRQQQQVSWKIGTFPDERGKEQCFFGDFGFYALFAFAT